MRHPTDRLGRRSLQRQPKSSPFQDKHGCWCCRDILGGWQDAGVEILRCAQDDTTHLFWAGWNLSPHPWRRRVRHPADRLGRWSLERQVESSPFQDKHGCWRCRDILVGWQDAGVEILRCAQDDTTHLFWAGWNLNPHPWRRRVRHAADRLGRRSLQRQGVGTPRANRDGGQFTGKQSRSLAKVTGPE